MAININPFDAKALADLAGQRMPDLNLKPYGVDVGAVDKGLASGLFEKATLNTQLQKMQADMMREQFIQNQTNNRQAAQLAATAQQGDLNRQNQYNLGAMSQQTELMKTAAQQQYQQQDLALRGQIAQNSNAVQQGNLLNEMQRTHLQQTAQDFNQKMQLTQDDRNKIGSVLGSYLYVFDRSQDPNVRSQAQQSAIQQARDAGLIDDATAAKVSKLNTIQFAQYAAAQAAMANSASGVHSMLGPQAQQMALTVGKDEDGNDKLSFTMGNTPQQTQDDMKDIKGSLDQLHNLQGVLNNYSQNALELGGKYQAALGNWASYSPDVAAPLINQIHNVAPFLTGGKSADELKQVASDHAEFRSMLTTNFMTVAKNIMGAAGFRSPTLIAKLQDAIANENDSPAEFIGHMNSAVKMLDSIYQARSNAIASGTKLNDPNYLKGINGQLNNLMENEFGQKSASGGAKTYINPVDGKTFYMDRALQDPRLKGKSEDEIAKMYNLKVR